MSELDALHAAEAALAAAQAALVAAEKVAEAPAPVAHVLVAETGLFSVADVIVAAGSSYLGHVGEPPIAGKDY